MATVPAVPNNVEISLIDIPPTLLIAMRKLSPEERRIVAYCWSIQQCDTPEQRRALGTHHAWLASRRRAMEAAQREAAAPHVKAAGQARAAFDASIQLYSGSEKAVERAMGAYDREERMKALREQMEANRKAELSNQKAEKKAEQEGTEPVRQAPAIVETVEKTVKSEDGSSSTKKPVKRWYMDGFLQTDDLSKVLMNDPRMAKVERGNMLLNVKRINDLVKQGGNEDALKAQGIIVYDDFEYTGRAKS